MSGASNSGFNWKVSHYWKISGWKTSFALYYAQTFEAAYAHAQTCTFPVKKSTGWCIENLVTQKFFYSLGDYRKWTEDDGAEDETNIADNNRRKLSRRKAPLEQTKPDMGQPELSLYRQEESVLFITSVGLGKPLQTKRRL